METTTKADSNNRELTSGEIKIALAQIEDRLHRVAKAQSEFTKFAGCDDAPPSKEYEYMMSVETEGETERDKEICVFTKKCDQLRIKYSIDEGVYLFAEDAGQALTLANYREILPRIKDWVCGKMTEAGFTDMYFFFEEGPQCDWGWILLESPFFYYDRPGRVDGGGHCEALVGELKKIGTRNHKKNHRPNVAQFSDIWGVQDVPPPAPKKTARPTMDHRKKARKRKKDGITP